MGLQQVLSGQRLTGIGAIPGAYEAVGGEQETRSEANQRKVSGASSHDHPGREVARPKTSRHTPAATPTEPWLGIKGKHGWHRRGQSVLPVLIRAASVLILRLQSQLFLAALIQHVTRQ